MNPTDTETPNSPQAPEISPVPAPGAFAPDSQPELPQKELFGGMFSRRIGRMGFLLGFVYWQLLLLLPLVGISVGIFMLNGGMPASLTEFYGSTAATMLVLFYTVVALLSLPVWLSLYIRRLHDIGQSGWWSVLSVISPINFFFALYLLFAKGEAEDNEYGKPVNSHGFMTVLGFKKPRE